MQFSHSCFSKRWVLVGYHLPAAGSSGLARCSTSSAHPSCSEWLLNPSEFICNNRIRREGSHFSVGPALSSSQLTAVRGSRCDLNNCHIKGLQHPDGFPENATAITSVMNIFFWIAIETMIIMMKTK